MKNILAIAASLFLASSALAAPDIQLTVTTNAPNGKFATPGTFTVNVTIKNNGPDRISAAHRLSVYKYDHTGQQYIKQIDSSKDIPLLDPPGGQLNSITLSFSESNPPTGVFYYKPGIGPGYYTDSNNANHKPQIGVTFSAPLRWESRLYESDFRRAGVTLTSAQVSKLNSNTYTIKSIVTGTTDRLVDGNRCSSCHTGNSSQTIPYAPVQPITQTNNHRYRATDASPTTGYNWANTGTWGVVNRFNANATKPDALKRIFKQWLNDGGR